MSAQFLSLNILDYAIIIVIVLSMVFALWRGLVREALSLTTWIAAIWVGLAYTPRLAHLMQSYISDAPLRMILAFFILFAIVLVLGTLVAKLVTSWLHGTGLGGVDRLLGMIFGAGRGILIVALLLLFAQYTQLPKETWWQQSTLRPSLMPVVVWLRSLLDQGEEAPTIKRAS